MQVKLLVKRFKANTLQAASQKPEEQVTQSYINCYYSGQHPFIENYDSLKKKFVQI